MMKNALDADRAAVPKRKNRLQSLLGFAAITLMVTTLYGLSVHHAWRHHPGRGAVVGLLLTAMLLALTREGRGLLQIQARALFTRSAQADFASVVGGAWITYMLSVHLDLGPVVASGLIGLLGALVFPAQAVPIYCGSFVGMSSTAILAGHAQLLLAAAAAGLIYNLTASVLQGFGGKLGAIAFTAVVAAGLGLGCDFLHSEIPHPPLTWYILIYAAAAALATYGVSVPLKHGPVVGSSIVGLVGGLLLPGLHPENGALLAVVVICASFTGMSSPSRIPNPFWMALAGATTGVIFIYSMPVLGGAGGKLGTIALGASLGTWALYSLTVGFERQKGPIPDKG